jgi:uncharacterized protein
MIDNDFETIGREAGLCAATPGTCFAFWRRLDVPGHDSAMLAPGDEGWTLTGFAAFREKGPTGLRYQVDLARDFSTRSARIDGFRKGEPFAHRFLRDGRGWFLDDRLVPGLDDLVHLDFGFTPSTNLQQLRHAGLAVGEEAEIPAAWFDIGEESLVRLPQHYRRLAEDRLHYASPTAGYEAVLELAPSGFVRLYPDLWEMEPER